eukprot:10224315-Alexandrium_andersonii.AAC.1
MGGGTACSDGCGAPAGALAPGAARPRSRRPPPRAHPVGACSPPPGAVLDLGPQAVQEDRTCHWRARPGRP